jgi:multiple sugar transport system substrate-binding protein
MGTADQQQSWNQLFSDFNKAYPGVKIKPTAVTVDNWAAFFDKVSTQLAGGVKYDLIEIATEGMQLFAGKDLIHPLDDLIARDKQDLSAYMSDCAPQLLDYTKQLDSPGGKTFYLPAGFNTMAMWVNTKVLHKAGVQVPDASWTWDDFLAAGRQIKQRTGAFLYPATAEYFIGVMPWLTTNGGSTMTADWKSATCDTPQAIEAAAFVRQLVKEQLSPPPGGSFDRFSLTTQGKMAMFGAGRWPVIEIRQEKAVPDMKIVPWPKKVKQGSPVGWNTAAIFKSSSNVEAAWNFVKYSISPDGMNATERVGSTGVPSRSSLATAPLYLGNSPDGTKNLFDALAYSTPIPSPLKGNLTQRAIEDNWGQILSGALSPEAGMKKMQSDVSSYL